MLEGVEDKNSALHIFDFAVNTGISRAIKTAQRLSGVNVDGVMGPKTIEAINKLGHVFTERYIAARKEYYTYLSNMKPQLGKFLQGWLNRVEHTKIYI